MFFRKRPFKLPDGELEFCVTIDGVESTWKADLVTLKLIAEQYEAKHKLRRDEISVYATQEFLIELAGAYQAAGCPQCDPTAARVIWIAVGRKFAQLETVLKRQLKRL